MINNNFSESFSQEWINKNITDPTNELVVMRKIIDWEKMVNQLSQFYCASKGRIGISIRVIVAVLLLSKLRGLSDEKVINQIKENRYYQYFCNVSDEQLHHFLHPSTLCRIRKRFGEKGVEIIEQIVFDVLRDTGVIDTQYALIDSSVLESNIIYPTDVQLIYKAFCKMALFAKNYKITLWWNHDGLKAKWREFKLNKEKDAYVYLDLFALMLKDALPLFKVEINNSKAPKHIKEGAKLMLDILKLLSEQTDLKLQGEKHIDNRIVSLDEPQARPIVKGKTHPKCEFGTTFQACFNRQGFMITVENLIGNPNDKTLYPGTLELFLKRMKMYPEIVVTDLGYRSVKNFKFGQDKVNTVFLGRSSDVPENKREACQKARSATEGFIAVTKNWRGMKRSFYKGFSGDRIWSLLCQAAHNLKKFFQLYNNEDVSEKSLMALGLVG
ncbi:MAG: transposase [Desulfamplus sp.]|nr:transposase [Desulfamplus sp.]